MRANRGDPSRVQPRDDDETEAAGRPEAARVVWRWDAPPTPAPAPRRPVLGPLVGLAVGVALVLSGRRFGGFFALAASALALAMEGLAPALAARLRASLAKAFTAAVLGAAYLALFTPLRLLRRGDPLRLTRDRGARSYWTPRDALHRDVGRPY